MTAIQNFLEVINDNWTVIIAIIGLMYAIYLKITGFIKMTKQEKIDYILESLDSVILDLMSNAEVYWQNFAGSGEIKRSMVIKDIYEKFPILSEYSDQEEVIARIDELITKYKPLMDFLINDISNESEDTDIPEEITDSITEIPGTIQDDTAILSSDSIQMIDEVETNGIGESE